MKWKKPVDDGGEPLRGYLVEKYDADSGMWLPVGETKDLDMDVTGLVPGHEYQFRVKAVNKEGESEPLETLAPIIAKDPFSTYIPESVTPFSQLTLILDCLFVCSGAERSSQSRAYRLESESR